MRRQHTNTNSLYLFRGQAVSPCIASLLGDVHPGLQAEFAELVREIWSEVLSRFRQPVIVKHSATRHTVTVLKIARYVVSHKSGTVSIEEPQPSPNGRCVFRRASFAFAVDLPFKPTPALFESLLNEWAKPIAALARHADRAAPLLAGLARVFRTTCLRTIWWKRLRYAIRAALDLDPEILDLAHRSRVNAHENLLSNHHYNQVVQRLDAFRQVRQDNPNLLWLCGLALAENIEIRPGGRAVLHQLRNRILTQFNLPPVAWRYLANGRRKDFRLIIDWLGPNVSPKGRWLELREWLRLLVALKRPTPIPLPVQYLFLHDDYKMVGNGHALCFRGAELPLHTVRCLLAEAEAKVASNTFSVFAENDLPDVLTWLGETGTVLDNRQQKAGWNYLLRQARQWKHESALQVQSKTQTWTSLIEKQRVGKFTLVPVTNVLQLHREALGMRNCANGFRADCLGGSIRLFAIHNRTGKQVGTVGLTRNVRKWQVLDVRGFANKAPSTELKELAEHLAERYSTLWTTLHPLLDQSDAVAAKLPARTTETAVTVALSDEGESDCIDNEGERTDDEEEACYEDEDEDRSAQTCPFCGDDAYGCEHLLAAVDYYNGGLQAGLLNSEQDSFLEQIWLAIQGWASDGRQYSGYGRQLDDILETVRNHYMRGEDWANVRPEIDRDLANLFYEFLEAVPGVETRYWEFLGGAPGTGTCGMNYWARDPEKSLNALIDLLLPGTGVAR